DGRAPGMGAGLAAHAPPVRPDALVGREIAGGALGTGQYHGRECEARRPLPWDRLARSEIRQTLMPFTTRRAATSAPPAFTETARLQGVDFGYAQGPRVLRDVDLLLPRGSFHFLTGPSGAGKSSLLRLLHLTAAPTKGRLGLFGEATEGLNRRDVTVFRRRIGVVFQDFRLMAHLSVFDNAALPLRLAGG